MKRTPAPRFGIGEWFGHLADRLTAAERLEFAQVSLQSRHAERPCPYRSDGKAKCNKDGGVCSIRLIEPVVDPGSGEVVGGLPATGDRGHMVLTCPYRFHADNMIISWVGETVLDDPAPMVAREIGFLESLSRDNLKANAGKIDMVLASEKQHGRLEWCALEIQAVYFSGDRMEVEFQQFVDLDGALAFPAGKRRPDHRSSGPKRLMPQLQTKVPTVARWGKKTAVVVDRPFIEAMAPMISESDLSNCDIAWFVVKVDDQAPGKSGLLARDEVLFTTLDNAVDGLTSARRITQTEFEKLLRRKLGEQVSGHSDAEE